MKVWMFAVFCLPFSLWNSLVLEFPFSDLPSDPAVSAVMLTLLHLLCTAQFCLNFIVYTILCGPVGQTYLTLFRFIGALSLVEIPVILSSHWLNLTMLVPRSMP